MLNVLVVGSGAREHALAWKLRQSPKVGQLLVAPGNAGTASIAQNVPIPTTDIPALAQAVRSYSIDLTVVGPEAPLAAGIVDRFRELGLPVFGPTRAAARIEWSKAFAKELMQKYGIPTARSETFDQLGEALEYLEGHPLPVVVKADGLAAGKGVVVARSPQEAEGAVRDCMEARVFGPAGDKVVIEEYLEGREVSVFAFTDGQLLSPLVAACDYKRVLDKDQGPNTGGMGAYSPPEFWTPELAECVRREIMEPAVKALAQEGSPYQGVLYGGLILTPEGPKVLEFNSRLGDPEAQVVLPRLKTDLIDVILAVIEGRLSEQLVEWANEACVGVVLASPGYPGKYPIGLPIQGLDQVPQDCLVFHAGTRLAAEADDSRVVTDGGRVLTVVAAGPTLAQARERAYAGVQAICFQGAHYRRDIALAAASLPSTAAPEH